jgi:DNA-directed RNA polymerase specialized sigma24 family protein
VRVAVALRAMPLRYQEAVTLRYIEEKEFNEIALILNCREGTARSLVSRGLTKLRELMSASVQQKSTERIIGTEGRSVLSTIK